MTTILSLLGRRVAPAPRPRPRIVAVTDHWRLVGGPGEVGREVLVRDVDGSLVDVYLDDAHPALLAFLADAAARTAVAA